MGVHPRLLCVTLAGNDKQAGSEPSRIVSNNVVVAEKQHSELGASVAGRWMACPGSVRLSRGIPNTSSVFAQEGTAAHALAELCLRKGVEPEFYIGTTIEGVEVTDEMAEHVAVYVGYCTGLVQGGDGLVLSSVEQKFTLAKLNPPGPMFGTADFVWTHPESGTMGVVDLKYGQGVVVEAKGNKQLRYYALGAVLTLDGWMPDRISMTIVQPRALHPDGPIRTEVITLAELIDFSAELIDAAKATAAPDAPLNPGAHCRFCPASGGCPAQRDHAQELAQIEFSAMPLDVPPDPETLPPEVFADILGKLHILEDWASAVRAVAYAKLERGEDVQGFKLVAKRATRVWRDPAETEQWLRAQGREDDEVFIQKLKSPAQVEKLVGKKNLPGDLVHKVSSGYNMVPVHHPGTAVSLTAGSEFFPALMPGESE
jgi:uncharacterized protein DUF2800